MIGFNVPPYIGTEMKYIEEAVAKNHKICGDGPFTKRCNTWLEKKTGTAKAAADHLLYPCHRDGSTAGGN